MNINIFFNENGKTFQEVMGEFLIQFYKTNNERSWDDR